MGNLFLYVELINIFNFSIQLQVLLGLWEAIDEQKEQEGSSAFVKEQEDREWEIVFVW